ncbi:PilZ domain-containing protein [Methylocucumis oryzae]|nr:PilZ domain-containing protein [Methylocucumis oryzae]
MLNFQEDTTRERRQHIRAYIETNYILVLDNQEFAGITGNISLSGAFLCNPHPELSVTHINEQGRLALYINNDWLQFRCEIVYICQSEDDTFPIGAGVVFQDEDAATSQAMLKLAELFDSWH